MDTENSTPEVFIEEFPSPTASTVEPYPVNLEIEYPEKSSRLLAFLSLLFFIPKVILLVPHLVALYFVQIVAFLAWLLAQFAVLFTARYPKSLFDFIVGCNRWQTRVGAYMMGLTDKYPPFRMSK